MRLHRRCRWQSSVPQEEASSHLQF